ncbi:MAG: RNA-binding domain-containing protein [Sphaerochaeta sp.]
MILEQIKKLLSLGDNQRIEFKSSIRNFEGLGKTVCGFLNSAGGYVICGVNERGEIIGIDDLHDVVGSLEQYLIENISPKAFVAVQVEELDKKLVISIEVPAGSDVPYAFKDVIYIRTGVLTQVAKTQTIRDIVMRHQIEPERWERRFSFADIEEHIDVQEVRATVSAAGNVRRVLFRDEKTISMVLEDFSVARYGRLTNGGDVLFTTNPAIQLPQTRIRAMRYSSGKAGDKLT